MSVTTSGICRKALGFFCLFPDVAEEETYPREGQNDVDFRPDTWRLLESKFFSGNGPNLIPNPCQVSRSCLQRICDFRLALRLLRFL